MLHIDRLSVCIEGKPILQDVSLRIERGETHALMGPNGAGKSTLSRVLAGDPAYEVTSGALWFKGENLLEMEPEERTRLGLFISFQYPVEIPGVTNEEFLKTAYLALYPESKESTFFDLLEEKMKALAIPSSFRERFVNTGFSGGEKKKNEMLQLALLAPACAILDETDSGLDIDAMRLIASGVRAFLQEKSHDRGLLVITHYQRLLDHIPPDHVHVMMGGRIIRSGGPELALELEKRGYDWLT